MVIDMAVVYPVATDTHNVAVAALMLDNDGVLTSAALTAALGRLPGDQRPAFVQIVDHIPLTPSYRPLSAALQSAGLPAAGETTWYYDRADGNYRQLTTTGSTHNV